MTEVRLVRSCHGAISSCSAYGHAGYAAAGSDIVCAAVSVLLRTAVQVLSETDGVVLETDIAARGNVFFSVKTKKMDPELLARLICVGDFLEKGIGSLSLEYPGNVDLQKQTEA